MAGRKRTPDALKIIKGTFRKDQAHDQIEVDVGVPDCPDWLNSEGKKYWSDVAPFLQENNLISVCDLSSFSLHCDSYGLFVEVSKRIENLDSMIDATPQGYEVQSVLVQIRNKLWDQVMKSKDAFGLSPQARSSIKAEPAKEKPKSPFDGI